MNLLQGKLTICGYSNVYCLVVEREVEYGVCGSIRRLLSAVHDMAVQLCAQLDVVEFVLEWYVQKTNIRIVVYQYR